MLNIFDTLINYVHADYHEAIRLLSIVGFEIGDPERLGDGMFRRFSLEKVG